MKPVADQLTTIAARLRASGSVYAEDEATLLIGEAKTPSALERMVARRVAGEPLEYIVGWAEFCGLRMAVEPGVFVPRQRSEFLVRQAARVTRPGSTVLDLCCGSGALSRALGELVPSLALHATDIDPVAVACAQRNLGSSGRVYRGDLYAGLPPSLLGRFDTILVNAPYVPTASIQYLPADARLHEPLSTLDGGADGLAIQRRVADGATDWLSPGGNLLIETSERQAAATAELFAAHGLATRVVSDEELDATVVMATRPA